MGERGMSAYAYRVENNIPLPPAIGEKYPFLDMQPGSSFLVKCAKADRERVLKNIGTAVTRFRAKSGTEYTFTTRSVDEGVRCWRVK